MLFVILHIMCLDWIWKSQENVNCDLLRQQLFGIFAFGFVILVFKVIHSCIHPKGVHYRRSMLQKKKVL